MRDQKKRIVIAPDSFKGTMTAIEVCRIIRKAFLQVDSALEICCLPMADGGEGTVDAFLSALGGERKTVRVHGPLFAMHNASFGILKDGTAILEMAAAARNRALLPRGSGIYCRSCRKGIFTGLQGKR